MLTIGKVTKEAIADIQNRIPVVCNSSNGHKRQALLWTRWKTCCDWTARTWSDSVKLAILSVPAS